MCGPPPREVPLRVAVVYLRLVGVLEPALVVLGALLVVVGVLGVVVSGAHLAALGAYLRLVGALVPALALCGAQLVAVSLPVSLWLLSLSWWIPRSCELPSEALSWLA